MKLKTILLAIVCGLFSTSLHASSESGQQGQEVKRQEITQSAYTVGGIVGTFTFLPGVGHAIQGRWSSGGWIHTALQGGLVVAVLVGTSVMFSMDDIEERKRDGSFSVAPLVPITLGSLAYIPLKIYEIISVWHIDTNKYQLVDKKKPSPVIVSPVLSNTGAGMMVAMSLP